VQYSIDDCTDKKGERDREEYIILVEVGERKYAYFIAYFQQNSFLARCHFHYSFFALYYSISQYSFPHGVAFLIPSPCGCFYI
jgi:hypothetical protein